MRTVTYGAACSLDGFIVGPGGALDWLLYSKDVEAYMKDYWARIDTLVMGRKTWEAATAQSGGKGGGMRGVKSYVFSRTLTSIPGKGVELVREDAGEFVRRLKAAPGKEICVFGGSDFARALFAAGLVDAVGLNIHPVLLGSGVPLFQDPGRRISLELKENRAMEGGCILALYRVR